MLPSLPTTTPPWQGPIADLPSAPSPQPGTVSNVITPDPIRAGCGVSAARPDEASPNIRAKATNIERFFMAWSSHCFGGVAGTTPAPSSRRTTSDGPDEEPIRKVTAFQSGWLPLLPRPDP